QVVQPVRQPLTLAHCGASLSVWASSARTLLIRRAKASHSSANRSLSLTVGRSLASRAIAAQHFGVGQFSAGGYLHPQSLHAAVGRSVGIGGLLSLETGVGAGVLFAQRLPRLVAVVAVGQRHRAARTPAEVLV